MKFIFVKVLKTCKILRAKKNRTCLLELHRQGQTVLVAKLINGIFMSLDYDCNTI